MADYYAYPDGRLTGDAREDGARRDAPDGERPSVAIRRQRVESRAIQSVGYDAEARIMHVEMARPRVVREYVDVAPALYHALMAAPSIGTFVFGSAMMGRTYRVVTTPELGTCGRCGDVGVDGCNCDDCGEGVYCAKE